MKQYYATPVNPSFDRKATRGRYVPTTQKLRVYDAVDAAGANGLTAPEIVAATNGLDIARVRFHLSELRRDGYIAIKGDPSSTVSPVMNAKEAAFAAMLSLENALLSKAGELASKNRGVIPAGLDIGFAKYNRIKERALRPGTPQEGEVAVRMALIELVKLVYDA